MNILLISNMYPNKKTPSYGTFVKNQVDILEKSGMSIKLSVMHKEKNIFLKLLSYLVHYIRSFFLILFSKQDIVYVHFASLNALPVLLAKIFKPSVNVMVNVHGS